MALKFYWAEYSTATTTVAVLNELEAALSKTLAERIKIDLRAGDTKKPEYISTIDPNGRVPVIVHDGVSIWESAAITLYLGETFAVDVGLWPKPGVQRGEAMKWVVWTNVTLTPGALKIQSNEKGSAEAEQGAADLRKNLTILDGALTKRKFLLGDQYSLADTHVYSFVRYFTFLGVKLEEYPKVKVWFDQIASRPALKDV